MFTLLLGLLNWNFFSSSAMMSTGSVVDAAGLIKSVAFPRAILPVATVLFNLAQFLLTMTVFLPIALFLFRDPAVAGHAARAPVLLALQILFTLGVAFALATATSFFRDVRHIMEIALGILFWTTPMSVSVRQPAGGRCAFPSCLSPMSPYVVAWQQIFHEGRLPDLAVWLVAGSYAAGECSCSAPRCS